jgi:quercetin dioxygenase-like cupin family protein
MHTLKPVTHSRWDDLALDHVNATFDRRLVSGEHITIAQVFLKPGGGAPKHDHVNEQFSCVMQGTLRFWIGDDPQHIDVQAGEVLHLPPNVPHRAEALDDVMVMDVFSPPRHDWVNRTDAYLREAKK